MKLKKKFIITDTQIGLLYKEQQFVKLLTAGVYEFWDWKNRYSLQSINITNTLADGVTKDAFYLAELHPETFADQLHIWETAEHEVGLVYQHGILRDIKAPGQRGAYRKQQHPITIEKLDISQQFAIPQK